MPYHIPQKSKKGSRKLDESYQNETNVQYYRHCTCNNMNCAIGLPVHWKATKIAVLVDARPACCDGKFVGLRINRQPISPVICAKDRDNGKACYGANHRRNRFQEEIDQIDQDETFAKGN